MSDIRSFADVERIIRETARDQLGTLMREDIEPDNAAHIVMGAFEYGASLTTMPYEQTSLLGVIVADECARVVAQILDRRRTAGLS